MRSRLGRMMSRSTALAGFQLPSLPSSFLFRERHEADTCAITRFANGAPLSFAPVGQVPVRLVDEGLRRPWRPALLLHLREMRFDAFAQRRPCSCAVDL